MSSQNHDFIELGDPRTRDTLIAYNVDHSTLSQANFAVVHGLGSKYGPVRDTRIFHNTTVLTGKGSVAIECSHVLTGDDLQIAGNIVWGEDNAVTCNDGFVESDNLYWASDGRPQVTFEIAPTSRKADPRLVDPKDGDLHLLPDSPAIDAIRPMDLGDIGATDAARVPVPQGYAPDIGAYEYSTEPPPSPTPAPLVTLEPTEPPLPTELPSGGPSASGGPVVGSGSPLGGPTPSAELTPPQAPTPTPRTTPTPAPRPSGHASDVPPPTGGPGALDQLILLVGVVGAGGILVAVVLARRSPA